MAITTKTITGKIVIPGTTTGIRAKVTATPMTDSRALTFPDDDVLTWGPVEGYTDAAGMLPTTFKIPTNSAQQAQLLWKFVAEPIDKHTALPKSWLMGEYQFTGTGTIDLADLVDVDVLGINTATYVSIQNYVASAQAAATSAAAASTSAAASATLAQTLVTSDLGTTDGQSFALVSDPNSQTGGYLGATYAGLAAAVNNFTGKIELDGGFTNSYDTDLWIAGTTRNSPTNNSQGMYIQHRVAGDLGGLVHDGSASELRVSGTNGGAGQNGFEASVVVNGPATLASVNAITANFHVENDPTGDIDSIAIVRAQTVPGMAGGITADAIYGVYVEPQTRGSVENWSLFAPTGNSLMNTLYLDYPTPSSSRNLTFSTNKVARIVVRVNGTAESGGNAGSDFEILTRTDAGGANFTALTITRATGRTTLSSLAVTGNVGFYGTTPIAKQTLAAAATDAATTQTLVNDIRTKLIALGLTA